MGSSSDRKLASAVGAKSARACDNCIKKRARWYCAADDAFLCQNCDSSVHSANPLAKRHERVRLKSFTSFDDDELSNLPSWHKGFTRKPRTSPRQRKKLSSFITRIVPEICNEEGNNGNGNGNGNGNLSSKDDNEFLYQVPIFDPFGSANSNNSQKDDDFMSEMNFLPSEMDLAEFAANVESLLGKGLEGESFDIESLGLLDCGDHHHDQMDEDHTKGCFLGGESVKFENDGEDFEFNFDYDDSPVTGEEAQIGDQEHILMMMNNSSGSCHQENDDSKKKILLKLDYDRVLSAWDDQKSPWVNGERPDLDSGDCWPDCVGSSGTMHIYGGMGVTSGHGTTVMDGAREARVSRYREKRQKRLFSKKIRYEVRKLNAQKRPRMKGRFVKRSNLVASALTTLIKT